SVSKNPQKVTTITKTIIATPQRQELIRLPQTGTVGKFQGMAMSFSLKAVSDGGSSGCCY
ncbi:UNVERIFIED_CONTAM: hypothetical protein RF648_20850, partial [Kocuria sp. CPCC 205274]